MRGESSALSVIALSAAVAICVREIGCLETRLPAALTCDRSGQAETQFQSGCCPSCAFHAHSVIFMSVKTAVNEESSGEQA